jgi:3-deoxy-D-manno-octulosonate 8-phosphate phosphatase (KDO 8-P phosphatase)
MITPVDTMQHYSQAILDKAKQIRLVIFDVDGVLTDGTLFLDKQGREYKSFHTRDGQGIKMLRDSGVEVAIISGRESESVTQRMEDLRISHVYQGQENKVAAFEALCLQLTLTSNQVAHVGDDLPDLPLMRRAGLAIAVNDAHFAVKRYAHWCTTQPGGRGAAREVCDLIMQAQNRLDVAISRYLDGPA